MSEHKNPHDIEPEPTEQFIDAVGSVEAYNNRHTGAVGGTLADYIGAEKMAC